MDDWGKDVDSRADNEWNDNSIVGGTPQSGKSQEEEEEEEEEEEDYDDDRVQGIGQENDGVTEAGSDGKSEDIALGITFSELRTQFCPDQKNWWLKMQDLEEFNALVSVCHNLINHLAGRLIDTYVQGYDQEKSNIPPLDKLGQNVWNRLLLRLSHPIASIDLSHPIASFDLSQPKRLRGGGNSFQSSSSDNSTSVVESSEEKDEEEEELDMDDEEMDLKDCQYVGSINDELKELKNDGKNSASGEKTTASRKNQKPAGMLKKPHKPNMWVLFKNEERPKLKQKYPALTGKEIVSSGM
jgi:hypothetical protein